jgi:hypothetical protein
MPIVANAAPVVIRTTALPIPTADCCYLSIVRTAGHLKIIFNQQQLETDWSSGFGNKRNNEF